MGAQDGFTRRQGFPGGPEDLHELAETSARRSLAFLQTIEQTISVLDGVADVQLAHARHAHDLAMRVWKLRPGTIQLDADSSLEASLQNVQEAARQLYQRYDAKKAAATKNPSIRDEDCVIEAYDVVLASCREMFDAFEELRTAVREFDADSSPVSKPTSDIDAFLSELNS